MPEYINKIRTDSGDLPVNYEALANLPTLSNPNLLINSDFRNPINQRGKTSYLYTDATTQYTVDRWRATGVNVAVGSSSILVKNRSVSTSSVLCQPFNQELRADTYTVTVGCQDVIGKVYVSLDASGTNRQALSAGINTFTFTMTSAVTGLYLFFGAEDTEEGLTLYYIKLEAGTTATPLVDRLYDEELEICQRYYQPVNLYFRPGITSSDGTTVTFTSDVHLRNLTDNNPTITMYQTPTVLRTTDSNAITTTLTFNNVYCLDGLIAITFNSSANLGARTTVWSYNSFKVYADAEVY